MTEPWTGALFPDGGGSDHHHEKDEHLSTQLSPLGGKRYERQIHAVQHELNRHENRDDIALDQESCYATGEQNPAQDPGHGDHDEECGESGAGGNAENDVRH